MFQCNLQLRGVLCQRENIERKTLLERRLHVREMLRLVYPLTN